MATDRLHIDRLTADTWAHWKLQLRLYLRAKNLWGIVNGDEEQPQNPQEAAAWEQRENQAMAVVGLSVDRSLLYLIEACETSAQCWDVLRRHFERTAGASVYHLLAQLFDLRMAPGISMEQHIKNFQELCSKLTAVNLEIQQQIRVTALLRSLPDKYEIIRTSLKLKGDDLTLEETMEALISDAQEKKGRRTPATAPAESAMSVQFRGRGRGRGG